MEIDIKLGENTEVLFSKTEIQNKVAELGRKISKDYKDKNLYIISLLKGSFIFTADLVREIDIDTKINFVTTSSYSNNTETTGKVKLLTEIKEDLTEYDILIADDIVDSGLTMDFMVNYLKSKNPKSIKSCVLLDKPSRRKVDITADYVGFSIEDKFVVGYGLNFGDYYRNIPYIFSLKN